MRAHMWYTLDRPQISLSFQNINMSERVLSVYLSHCLFLVLMIFFIQRKYFRKHANKKFRR